jgi:hypothetical protein
VSVNLEPSSGDWQFIVASAATSDPSGVSTVNISVQFEWACIDEGHSFGGEQSTGEIDPFTAANGWGFGSDAICELPGSTPVVVSVTVWATAVDTLGNGTTSSHRVFSKP